ncbi:thioredoxin family protein [Ciceribacter ferrooxidans]|uniref:Thioredoxin family protein n=1 Tax=Ciceribacter ferrooxidans TaxID=2509717 RepID=A0A4Q2T242_9HYPH|nr:thioredoxin family protein [Ciceribacter ferrooxidans]RYC10719.1 thioredoxin family protein [Ciceribacter ferrooxidans]
MAATAPLCDFGWKAVDARLPGVDGRTSSILDHAGPRGLVVAFICNHCPYVKAVIARIVRDARDLAGAGVGFVAINSNDALTYPEDSFENMQRFSAEHALPFPYLYDEDQSVARTYGAVCTPDFFGFNAAGELQYRGRLDASRKEAVDQGLRRDLYEAMLEVARTGRGPAEQHVSIGCSIKWKSPS